MTTWRTARRLQRRDEGGATAVEYAMMLAFITVVIAGTLVTFGIKVSNLFVVNL